MILLAISFFLMGSLAHGQMRSWYMQRDHPPQEAVRSTPPAP
jgi:hypothetical protein